MLPRFLLTTTVDCLPALIALLAWSEGGSRIARQFGPRMLWEVAGVVTVGVGFLLYATVQVVPEEGANVLIIVLSAMSSGAAITAVTQRWRPEQRALRIGLSAAVALIALGAGMCLGLGLYLAAWPSSAQ